MVKKTDSIADSLKKAVAQNGEHYKVNVAKKLKVTSFALEAEDEQTLSRAKVFLMQNGVLNPNGSQIIRTLLSIIKLDDDFLQAYQKGQK